MKIFIKVFYFVLVFVLLCSCSDETYNKPSIENNPILLEQEENVDKVELNQEEQQSNKEPKEYYAAYYNFEIPCFSDVDNKKLPLYEPNGWCVNGNLKHKQYEQIIIKDEIAMELADAIHLIDGFNFRFYDFNEFECISEANNQYLLYAAVSSTPEIMLNYNYNYINGKPVAELPEPDNIVSKVCAYAHEEYNMAPIEVFYVEDVEKTFHYLFGTNIEFVPETIHNRCYRYVPEANVYLYFLEGPASAKDSYPQIISYNIEDNIYTVEAILVSVFDYNEEGNLITEITEEDILSYPTVEYVFEREKDGHFVLISITSLTE